MEKTNSPITVSIGKIAVLLWIACAVALAVFLPPPFAPPPLRLAMIFVPVAATTIALFASASLAGALERIDARKLVALHGIRLVVGAAFLFFMSAGMLPRAFGLNAGIGDMLAGASALALVLAWRSLEGERGRALLAVWNVAGLIDFLNVQRVVFQLRGHEQEFIAMTRLPMSIVPYLGVGVLFSIHILLLTRLARGRWTSHARVHASPVLLLLLVASISSAIACSPEETAIRMRVANLSVEAPSVTACVEEEAIATVDYATMTRYLDVSAPDALRVELHAASEAGEACDSDAALASESFSLSTFGDARDFSVVIFGNPNDTAHPLTAALLADDLEPAPAMRAKARNFGTDTEAPPIDIGFPRPDGQHMLIFADVEYGHTARSTAIGAVSSRGYVEGIPTPFPAPRLFVWPSGGADPLGYFEARDVPFAAGKVYSVFPAGRVRSGIPEAVICEDTLDAATPDAPLSSCQRFTALRP